MSARGIVLSMVTLLAACAGEGEFHAVTGLPEERATLQAEGRPTGTLLHEHGLIQNPEVLARAQEAAAASRRGTAARDSASRAFRAWLEDWVKKNPDRVVEADGIHPRPMTPLQRAEQHRQLETERLHRAKSGLSSARQAPPGQFHSK